MANVLTSLAEGLGNLVAKTVKFRAMDKSDLQKVLRDNIEGHQKIAYILSMQSDRDMQDWYRDVVKPALRSNQTKAKPVFENYLKMINGKASAEERKRPLGSLLAANQQFAKILEEISKKIDYLFENDSVDLWNVRMSHLAVLGIVKQSDMVLNFSIYLYTFLSRVASRTTTSIPRYREVYMLDKLPRVASIVSDILNKKGPYLFLQEVDRMRKQQRDIVLGASGDFKMLPSLTSIAGFSSSFLDNLLSALSCLNIFSAALDAWDDYKLAKYERNKEIKEWLESHVTLLRMDLEEMDKNSAEYMRLVNIIEAYDAKIADYDKEILAFEQAE